MFSQRSVCWSFLLEKSVRKRWCIYRTKQCQASKVLAHGLSKKMGNNLAANLNSFLSGLKAYFPHVISVVPPFSCWKCNSSNCERWTCQNMSKPRANGQCPCPKYIICILYNMISGQNTSKSGILNCCKLWDSLFLHGFWWTLLWREATNSFFNLPLVGAGNCLGRTFPGFTKILDHKHKLHTLLVFPTKKPYSSYNCMVSWKIHTSPCS